MRDDIPGWNGFAVRPWSPAGGRPQGQARGQAPGVRPPICRQRREWSRSGVGVKAKAEAIEHLQPSPAEPVEMGPARRYPYRDIRPATRETGFLPERADVTSPEANARRRSLTESTTQEIR